MKLRLIQKDINNSDYKKYLEDAKGTDCDILCFSELAVSGCLYDGVENRVLESLDSFQEDFKEYSFDIMIGIPNQTEDSLRNSYVYFDNKNSSYQVYNKVNLFEPMNETRVYKPGEKPGVFESEYGKLGALICYDLRFPDMFSELKEQGVDIVFVPAAFPRVRISDWKELMVKRAVDNSQTIVAINAVGTDSKYEFGGSSMVVSPAGEVIAQADEINEKVLEVVI